MVFFLFLIQSNRIVLFCFVFFHAFALFSCIQNAGGGRGMTMGQKKEQAKEGRALNNTRGHEDEHRCWLLLTCLQRKPFTDRLTFFMRF